MVVRNILKMPTCKHCGAKWRINYPFGRNSKKRITWVKKHKSYCRYRR